MHTKSSISKASSKIDALLTSAYRSLLEPDALRSFLRDLRTALNCDIVNITLGESDTRFFPRMLMLVDAAWPFEREDYLALLNKNRSQIPEEWQLQAGDFYNSTATKTTWPEGNRKAYQELLNGWEMRQGVTLIFQGSQGNLGSVSGLRKTSGVTNRFTAEEEHILRGLYPHIENIMGIYTKLSFGDAITNVLNTTLNQLDIAAFILDTSGKIIHSNILADELLKKKTTVLVRKGRLTLANNQLHKEFERMMKEVVWWRMLPDGSRPIPLLRLNHDDDNHLGMLVRPIERQSIHINGLNPSVAVYIGDPQQRHATPEATVSQLFGLTMAEANVATMLTNGYSQDEVAGMLGLTKNTVRSYARIIYAKVGVNRQAELSHRILKSIATLAG